MRKLAFLTTLAIFLMMAVFVGCSDDDDNNGTGSGLNQGDTTSEDFQFIEENVGEGAFNTIGYSLELSFNFIDSIPGPPTSSKYENRFGYSAADSIIAGYQYSYDSINGWHVFLFDGTIYDDIDTISIAGTDSIQVTKDGDAMQYPDSTMNGIKIRKWFEFGVNNDNTAHGEGHHSYDIDASQFETNGIGTIDGSTMEYLSVYVADSNATCTLQVENNVTINTVALLIDDVEDSCPQSGSVTAVSDLMLNCTGTGEGGFNNLSIDGTWTLTAQFNGTSETITFSDGTTQWSVTEDCGNPPAISDGLGTMVVRQK